MKLLPQLRWGSRCEVPDLRSHNAKATRNPRQLQWPMAMSMELAMAMALMILVPLINPFKHTNRAWCAIKCAINDGAQLRRFHHKTWPATEVKRQKYKGKGFHGMHLTPDR